MLSREKAIELAQTVMWVEFCSEIDARINVSLQELVRCNKDSVDALQQRILAFEEVKRIPQSVVDRTS